MPTILSRRVRPLPILPLSFLFRWRLPCCSCFSIAFLLREVRRITIPTDYFALGLIISPHRQWDLHEFLYSAGYDGSHEMGIGTDDFPSSYSPGKLDICRPLFDRVRFVPLFPLQQALPSAGANYQPVDHDPKGAAVNIRRIGG